jgi:hypothetical protein
VDREYIDKNGKPQVKKSITYNAELRSRLKGALAPSMLIAKPKDPDNYVGYSYAKAYYDYKNRQANKPKYAKATKIHLHNMATRYMIKRFLVDLYMAWKKVEGLPMFEEYAADKLGLDVSHHRHIPTTSQPEVWSGDELDLDAIQTGLQSPTSDDNG